MPWFGPEMPPKALRRLMNLPTLISLGLVLAYPIFYAAYLSFHRVSAGGVAPRRVSVRRFRQLPPPARRSAVLLSLKNTLIFTAFSVTTEIVLAMRSRC